MKRSVFERGDILNGTIVIIGVVLIVVVGLIFALDPVKRYKMRQDTLRREAFSEIQASLEKFYDDFGRYPVSSSEYLIMDPRTNKGVLWGKIWPVYATPLPKDPEMGKSFIYISSPRNDYQSYGLYGAFSYPEEVGVVCSGDSGCVRVPKSVLCGKVACSGGVASPNSSP